MNGWCRFPRVNGLIGSSAGQAGQTCRGASRIRECRGRHVLTGIHDGTIEGLDGAGPKQRNDLRQSALLFSRSNQLGLPDSGALDDRCRSAVVPLLKLTLVAKHRDRVLAVTNVMS